MTLISRQVSRAAQTVTTKYHSLVTALPLYDCMDTASMLLSSLYHHRVGEGGREGGREGGIINNIDLIPPAQSSPLALPDSPY